MALLLAEILRRSNNVAAQIPTGKCREDDYNRGNCWTSGGGNVDRAVAAVDNWSHGEQKFSAERDDSALDARRITECVQHTNCRQPKAAAEQCQMWSGDESGGSAMGCGDWSSVGVVDEAGGCRRCPAAARSRNSAWAV